MQDIDRPAHVQLFSQPPRHRGSRVQAPSLCVVPRSETINGIATHFGRSRDFGQDPPVRTTEPQLAIRLSVDPVALFVDGAVVPAT